MTISKNQIGVLVFSEIETGVNKFAAEIDAGFGVPTAWPNLGTGSAVSGVLNAGTQYGYRLEFPSADFTTDSFAQIRLNMSNANPQDMANVDDGGFCFVFEDSSGNWSRFDFWGRNWGAGADTEGQMRAYRYGSHSFTVSRTPEDTGGTPADMSDIVAVEVQAKNYSSDEQNHSLVGLYKRGPALVTGTETMIDMGSDLYSVNDPGFQRPILAYQSGYYSFADGAGAIIGDGGTTATDFTATNFSVIPYFHGSDAADNPGTPWFTITEDRVFRVDLGAADSAVFTSGSWSWKGSNGAFYRVQAYGVTGATLTFARVTFDGISGVDANYGAFTRCVFTQLEDGVTVEASDVTMTACTISDHGTDVAALTITGAAGDYSGLVAEFDGNTTYDVVLDGGAGTYDLTGISGASGYTVKIHNASATDAVTVQLAEGVVYSTSTEGGTITVTSPPVTYDLVFPNIIDGSRYRVFNVTQDAEIANALVSGGTGIAASMILGTDYDANDEIRVRITALEKLDREIELQPGAANGAFSSPITQADDDIYLDAGIDGTAVTIFTPDYAELEIDIAVASDFTLPELYAWYKNAMTTEDGIRYFFGAVVAVDAANFMVDVSRADMRLDNVTATEVIQTDNRRLYRSDGQRPAKTPTTGGGGIDVNYQPTVLIAETGVSGLTPSESVALAQIAQVLAKVDPLPADPVGISDLPDAPDNDGIAAIRAQTDKLPDNPASSGDVEDAAIL